MIMMIVMITMTVMMITGIPGLAVPACSRYLMTAATEMSPPFHTQCLLHTAMCIVAPMHTGQNSSAFESSAHPLHTGMFCTLLQHALLSDQCCEMCLTLSCCPPISLTPLGNVLKYLVMFVNFLQPFAMIINISFALFVELLQYVVCTVVQKGILFALLRQ